MTDTPPAPLRIIDAEYRDTAPVKQPLKRGYIDQRPLEQREQAYQLWATSDQRSLRTLAAQLTIPRATLARWSREDGWQSRYTRDRLAVAPAEAVLAATAELYEAATLAAQYIGDVHRGEATPDRLLLAFATAALDRAGLGPVRTMEPPRAGVIDVGTSVSAADLAELDDAGLARLAASLHERTDQQ